jgi:LysM repeat protein
MKYLSKRYARITVALVVAVLLIAAISGSAAAAGPTYHTVQPGQTLYWIAGHYGVSVWSVACANGLWNPNYIYAGMVLYIPGGWNGYGCKPNYQPPKPCCQDYNHDGYGKDGYGCCNQNYGCCNDGYVKNYCCNSYPKYGCCNDGYGKDCYYTVKWGDDLYRIALKYGTSWVTLAYANGLGNANYVYAGQVLRIPHCN